MLKSEETRCATFREISQIIEAYEQAITYLQHLRDENYGRRWVIQDLYEQAAECKLEAQAHLKNHNPRTCPKEK